MDRTAFIVSIIVAVICASLLYLAGAEDSSQNSGSKAVPTTIIFSHVVGQHTPKGIGALMFKRLVKERLADKVAVQVYPNALLYSDGFKGVTDKRDKVMDALKAGKVHLAAPSLSQLSDKHPALKIFDLPFLFEDGEEADKFYQENQKLLVASLEKDRYRVLAHWQGGMKQLSANKSLKAPSDVQNLTFRIQFSNTVEASFTAMGAEVKKMDFEAVYKALERGEIDGQENTWSNIYSEKYFEIGNQYFRETNHGYLGYLLITHATFWDKLSSDERSTLEKIIKEVTEEVNEQAKRQEGEAKEKLKGKSIKVEKIDREEWCGAIWGNPEKRKDLLSQIDVKLLKSAKTVSTDQNRCPFPQIGDVESSAVD